MRTHELLQRLFRKAVIATVLYGGYRALQYDCLVTPSAAGSNERPVQKRKRALATLRTCVLRSTECGIASLRPVRYSLSLVIRTPRPVCAKVLVAPSVAALAVIEEYGIRGAGDRSF